MRLSAAARALIMSGGLALGFSSLVSAQTLQSQAWQLQNFRARWCVYFLMDSTTADKELPREYLPRRAADFPGLSPAVARMIKDDSSYGSWVPAQFCTTHFDQARVDDRAVGDSATIAPDAQILSTWLIGATSASDTTRSRPTYFVADLRSSNWRLLRQGEIWMLRGERVESELGKVPESTEDLYRVRMGRTVITWEGHLAGDSAWAAPAVEENWYAQSSRNALISARASFHADSAQNIAGTLRIEGKDDLAKSLRASPVRMVGPMMWGGGGAINFTK